MALKHAPQAHGARVRPSRGTKRSSSISVSARSTNNAHEQQPAALAESARDAVRGGVATVGGGVVLNMLAAAPAGAQGMFDFDLTLPIEAAQVLLLMVALDKLVYKPVGDVIDQRDEDIRNKLASVKDNSEEVNGIYEQARKVVAEARQEVNERVAAAKRETQEENERKLNEAKARLDSELEQSMQTLREQQDESLNQLEDSADALADRIVAKVLPVDESSSDSSTTSSMSDEPAAVAAAAAAAPSSLQ